MANPFQQKSRLRKLIYFGLILALFTISLMHRRFFIEPEAMALQLREQASGEVELTSSAVRLTLIGSRGIATAALWYTAREAQKKQQWNELELIVQSITKLQPHFISPWRFQGWNLAFNVAVECGRARDKFFYISRGLELLAEGERRNQGTQEADPASGTLRFPGNPDMRFDLGFFYQLKIAHSDDKYFMRSLLDMSCIDPAKRDPARFWAVDARGRRIVNEAELEAFCRSNPRLVRRLRDHMGRELPQQIIAFLEDNQEIPSRFENPSAASAGKETPLKKPREQFPILPNPRYPSPNLPDLTQSQFPYSFDVHRASAAWYNYAQEPLPPPDPDEALRRAPFDKVHYRLPKMATIIFRSYPARVTSYIAENLEEEGFFDNEDGWTIDDTRWFKSGPVTVGTETKYRAAPAWQIAYEKYLELGERNGLYFSNAKLLELGAKAMLFMNTYLAKKGTAVPRPDQLQGAMAESFEAKKRMDFRDRERNLVNYDSYLNQAAVELQEETVTTRKLFFRAKRLKEQFLQPQAIQVYEEAFPRWLEILLANPNYRRIPEIQNETFELEMRFLSLKQRRDRERLKSAILGVLQMGMVHLNVPFGANLPLLQLRSAEETSLLPLKLFEGPLERIYLLEAPPVLEDALRDYLVAVAAGAQQPLIIPSPFQQNRALMTEVARRDTVPAQIGFLVWRPLIGDPAIRETRQMHRLDLTPPSRLTSPPNMSGIPGMPFPKKQR
jgi:hypothetical protein